MLFMGFIMIRVILRVRNVISHLIIINYDNKWDRLSLIIIITYMTLLISTVIPYL